MLLTTAWDERMLDTVEIETMETEHKQRRAELSLLSPNRWKFWMLDRSFFRSVRNGKTVNDSREDAMFVYGIVCGILIFVTFIALFGAFAVVTVGAAVAGKWSVVAMNISLYALGALVGSGLLLRALTSIWRKVRHKDD